MIFEYILAALAYFAAAWTPREPLLPPGFPWAPGAAVASVLLTLLFSFGTVRAVERWMRNPWKNWGTQVFVFGCALGFLRVLALALFAAAVRLGGWGIWAEGCLGPAAWPGVREAAVLAPFLASFAGGAVALSRVEGGKGGAAAYVACRLRGAAAILGLLVAGGAAVELLSGPGGLGALVERRPWLEPVLALAAFAASASLLPIFLRVAWSTAPLPAGETRDALLAFGQREGLRFREVRLWDAGGTDALNAAVAGLLPATRTVFLTRALLEYLPVPQVLAVFAHEAGHVRGRHGWTLLALGAGWAGFASAAHGGLLDPGGGPGRWALQAGLAAGFVLLLLAYLRRAEHAADLWSATALGDPELVCETLGHIAQLNGNTGALPSLTHPSVEARIAFVQRMVRVPAAAERFRWAFAVFSGVIAGAALLGLAAAAPGLL